MSDLAQTIKILDRCFRSQPEVDLQAVFAASFLAQVPLPQLEQMFRHLEAQVGACTGHTLLKQISDTSASVRWHFERGFHMDGSIAIVPDDGKIVHLHLGLPGRLDDSWRNLTASVQQLPGDVSLLVMDLTRGTPVTAIEPQRLLGVGSTSKLVLFACLLEEIRAGRRRWTDLLELSAAHASAPSGILHSWPIGSPLSVHTVAALLLSMSDNTAADLLLDALGRPNVEKTLERIGVGRHPFLRPFPSTRGVFRLVSDADLRRRYLEGDERARRLLLGELERLRPQTGDLTAEPWPAEVDWFFSAEEVCAILDHIRRVIDDVPGARAIFGMNPGGLASERWRLVGYKGGFTPGRIAFAAALEDERAQWFAICLSVNATPATLSFDLCASLFKRATDLALNASSGPVAP